MWRSDIAKILRIAAIAAGLVIMAPSAQAAENPPQKLKIVKGGIEIALASDGLVIIDPSTGKTVPLPFGASWRLSNSVVYYATGDRPFNSANAECGTGAMEFSRFDKITLNFLEGRFVGWSVGAANPARPLKTVGGVGRDSRRVELVTMAGYSQVADSTLGDEFIIDADSGYDLSGLFSGPEPDAQVTDIWAGTNCIFR